MRLEGHEGHVGGLCIVHLKSNRMFANKPRARDEELRDMIILQHFEMVWNLLGIYSTAISSLPEQLYVYFLKFMGWEL